jgi:hypothetical protein
LVASTLIAFCYAGNYGCYLNWARKPRYTKWNAELDDLNWDEIDEEDEDLIGGQHLYRKSPATQRASTTSTSKDCFEMK